VNGNSEYECFSGRFEAGKKGGTELNRKKEHKLLRLSKGKQALIFQMRPGCSVARSLEANARWHCLNHRGNRICIFDSGNNDAYVRFSPCGML
jgi:hypothetical protein